MREVGCAEDISMRAKRALDRGKQCGTPPKTLCPHCDKKKKKKRKKKRERGNKKKKKKGKSTKKQSLKGKKRLCHGEKRSRARDGDQEKKKREEVHEAVGVLYMVTGENHFRNGETTTKRSEKKKGKVIEGKMYRTKKIRDFFNFFPSGQARIERGCPESGGEASRRVAIRGRKPSTVKRAYTATCCKRQSAKKAIRGEKVLSETTTLGERQTQRPHSWTPHGWGRSVGRKS